MSELFDQYAADYDSALEQGISVSGESKLFFVRERVRWLKKCLEDYDATPRLILDFGCGTGAAAQFLLEFADSKLIGLDTSEKSLQQASRVNDPERTEFLQLSAYDPSQSVDLAYCNGVFHHVPPDRRDDQVAYLFNSLQAGGFFAFWENNPWNPGTRFVMSRIPFDRDAKTLTAPEARRMLKRAGFQILRTDFLFIFPHFLRWLRPLETHLTRLPFGAQYQILCRKG